MNKVIKQLLTTPSSVSPPVASINNIKRCIKATFDSGASGNYIRPCDRHAVHDIERTIGPQVTMPTSETVCATESASLPLSEDLPKEAEKGHIIPNLQSSTLISVGTLCDNDCDVIFQQKKVHVLKCNEKLNDYINQQQPLLVGERNMKNRLGQQMRLAKLMMT